VAEQLTATDVLRAHARDELGIDLDELANPLQVSLLAVGTQKCVLSCWLAVFSATKNQRSRDWGNPVQCD
jgi:hypothetical protein